MAAPDDLPAWGPVLHTAVSWCTILALAGSEAPTFRSSLDPVVPHRSMGSLCHKCGELLRQASQSQAMLKDVHCCRARMSFYFLPCRGTSAGGKGRVACTGRAEETS